MAKEKKITKAELNKITSKIKKSAKPKPYTLYDVLGWLFDGGSHEVPLVFIRNKSTLLNTVQLIIPKFRNNLKMISFMNLNFNNLYIKRTGEEILIFLKSYIQQNRIERYHLDDTKYRFDKVKGARDRFIESQTQSLGMLDGGDMGSILSEFDMIQTNRFHDKITEEKINIALGNKEEVNLDNVVAETLIRTEQAKRDKDPRFLKALNQETINNYKLTLIDIKSLDKLNKILLVFIDENNKKKFFVDEFSYEFAISNINSIVYNDYMVQFDNRYHTWIICNDIQSVTRLRMSLNSARDQFYRSIAWDL